MSTTTNEKKEANIFKHDKWLNKKQHKQKNHHNNHEERFNF
jgi:hypothetical protein